MLNFIFTFKLGFIECDIHESKDKIVKLLNFSNYKNNIIFILNLVFLLVWINLNCTEKNTGNHETIFTITICTN